MNLPNKLTFSRLVLTPIGFFVFYFSTFKTIYGEPVFNTTIRVVLSVLFFLLLLYMEISDLIDGKIARKNGLVTDLGKIFDPFSDMFMHMSVFFCICSFFLHAVLGFFDLSLQGADNAVYEKPALFKKCCVSCEYIR